MPLSPQTRRHLRNLEPLGLMTAMGVIIALSALLLGGPSTPEANSFAEGVIITTVPPTTTTTT